MEVSLQGAALAWIQGWEADRPTSRLEGETSHVSQALSYDYLYFFSAQDAALVEIKVTSAAADAPPEEVYHWLYAEDRALQKLVFKSMREHGGRNFRAFVQGQLVFDAAEARLTLGVAEIQLAVVNTASVPDDLDRRVRTFLEQAIRD